MVSFLQFQQAGGCIFCLKNGILREAQGGIIRICIQSYSFECEYDNGSDSRIEQGDDEIGEEAYN